MHDNLTFAEGSCGLIDSPSTPPSLPSFSRGEGGILCFRVLLALSLPPPSLLIVSLHIAGVSGRGNANASYMFIISFWANSNSSNRSEEEEKKRKRRGVVVVMGGGGGGREEKRRRRGLY